MLPDSCTLTVGRDTVADADAWQAGKAWKVDAVPPSDGVLLQRFVAAGDQAAFAELARRHIELARRASRRVLGPAGDAEDAAQAALVALARHAVLLAERVGPAGSLAGWIHRVAVNAALQQRRATVARRRREQRAALERPPSAVADSGEHAELLAVLDEELCRLPLDLRNPVVLCHLEGHTQHEAAVALGLTFGTLRRRLERGRVVLHRRMVQRGLIVTGITWAALWRDVAAGAASGVTAASGGMATCALAAETVAFVRPRVTEPGRVSGATGGVSGASGPRPWSAKVYTLLLGTLILVSSLPPVCAAFGSGSSAANSHAATIGDANSAPGSQGEGLLQTFQVEKPDESFIAIFRERSRQFAELLKP